jgi:acetyl esterase/lipase
MRVMPRALLALVMLCLTVRTAGVASAASADLLAKPHIDYGRGVLGLPHLTYEVVNGYRPIQLSLFVPMTDSVVHPIVLYLHGGGFTLDPDGDEGIMGNDTMVELAARGYLVARPAYRLSSEARFPAAIEDVKIAVRWLRTYARDYGGDASHIVVWGSSAGGDLAALLGTSCGVAAFDRIEKLPQRVGLSTPALDPNASSCVDAVIDWFGPIDFATLDRQSLPGSMGRHDDANSPESALLGCALPRCPQALLKAANPISYISATSPPFLIMHGQADHAVPWQQSQELYDALRAQGVAAQLILVPGADHMFTKLPPAQMQAQLAPVFAFIDAHSGRAAPALLEPLEGTQRRE